MDPLEVVSASSTHLSPQVLSLGLGIALLFLLATLRRKASPSLQWIGVNPGIFSQRLRHAKQVFTSQGGTLICEAYRKNPDQNYYIQTDDVVRIVVSPRFLPELKMLSETHLSHRQTVIIRHLGRFTGMDTVLTSNLHNDVCRVHLTRNLPTLLLGMINYAEVALSDMIPKAASEGTAIISVRLEFFNMAEVLATGFETLSAGALSYSVASRVFSYVSVGEPFCNDKLWLESVSKYPGLMISVADTLRPLHRWLRPIASRLLRKPRELQQYRRELLTILKPEIEKRRLGNNKRTDILQWVMNRALPSESDYDSILSKMMFFSMAAIHTTSAALTIALYDLCLAPEYIESLRLEVKTALTETGGEWTKEVFDKKLLKMDSFLKESQRYNTLGPLGFHRLTMQDIRLSDGSILPKGWFLSMPAEAMSRDPRFYDDPDVFDGYRFLHRRQKADLEGGSTSENDFVGIQPGSLSFGQGRFTCPGRWFANVELKFFLGNLLLSYDVRLSRDDQARLQTASNIDRKTLRGRKAMIEVRKL